MIQVVTAETVLDAVKELAEKNPDKVYKPVKNEDGFYNVNCKYTKDATGTGDGHCCIIGQALLNVGFPLKDLAKFDEGIVPDASETLKELGVVSVTEKTFNILNEIQMYQDDGTPWGEAVTYTVEAHNA